MHESISEIVILRAWQRATGDPFSAKLGRPKIQDETHSMEIYPDGCENVPHIAGNKRVGGYN